MAIPEILRIVALDPAIAAEILVTANSPLYGFPSRVYTVQEAVMILGWDQTKRILEAAALTAQPSNINIQSVIGSSWAHSLLSAFIAAEISPLFSIPADRAYTMALMHDIGRLGMLATSADRYLNLMTLACDSVRDFLGMEEFGIGMNHCKAGLWLHRAWGLPVEFAETAAHHHEAITRSDQPAVTLVGLACRLAHLYGFSVEPCKSQGLDQAISYAGPALSKELAARLDQIHARSNARLLEHTVPFCDIETMRRGAAPVSGQLHSVTQSKRW